MKKKIQKTKQANNSELITFLDKKFQRVDQQFQGVDKKFQRVDQQFEGVCRGLELTDKRIDGLEIGFGELKSDFRKLQSSIDNYAKRADTYFQEMLMLSRKVDRLEKWILQIAEKVDLHLKS